MRIGILGGTFDPIHLGHLIIAEEARLKLELSKVIFIPAGQPWLKANRFITPKEQRLEMVKLATSSNPYFEVSTAEIEREGPSYSVDTVSALREELGSGVELYFIVGPDALAGLPLWKEPARLVRLCQIVWVSKPNSPNPDLAELEAAIPGISSQLKFIPTPQIGISSTEIRERVAKGLSIRYLVPQEVERYIYEHKLYLK